jgi:aspartate racemase
MKAQGAPIGGQESNLISDNFKIGILGGIGPEASAYFYSKIIERLQNEGKIKSNIDYPQIILNSIPAPELLSQNLSEKDLEPYIKGIQELSLHALDFIVMVCNTIHIFHPILQSKTKIEILNIREAITAELINKGIKRIILLATPATINSDLYNFDDIEVIKPDKNDFDSLQSAVSNFNKGNNKQDQINLIKEIIGKYIIEKSDYVLLGCTEFALMLKDSSFNTINSIDALLNLTINKISQSYGQ